MTVLLGGDADEAMAMLSSPEPASEIAQRLRDPRKAVRAQTLAMAIAEVKLALDEGALR